VLSPVQCLIFLNIGCLNNRDISKRNLNVDFFENEVFLHSLKRLYYEMVKRKRRNLFFGFFQVFFCSAIFKRKNRLMA
jgi:hypothetical protein